jgi:hypothetical protein
MPALNALPNHSKPRREKVFGFVRGFAHDRNARVRIEAYVTAWNAKNKQEGQHQGPITAAYQRVLQPSYGTSSATRTGFAFSQAFRIDKKASLINS